MNCSSRLFRSELDACVNVQLCQGRGKEVVEPEEVENEIHWKLETTGSKK